MVSRGTTPTLQLVFPEDSGVDLTEASHVYVTFRNSGHKLTKSDSDLVIESRVVSVYLSQAETLSMVGSDTKVQINWTFADGSRDASEVVHIEITENLLNEVLQ